MKAATIRDLFIDPKTIPSEFWNEQYARYCLIAAVRELAAQVAELNEAVRSKDKP